MYIIERSINRIHHPGRAISQRRVFLFLAIQHTAWQQAQQAVLKKILGLAVSFGDKVGMTFLCKDATGFVLQHNRSRLTDNLFKLFEHVVSFH